MKATNNQFRQSRSQYYKMKMQRKREMQRKSYPDLHQKFTALDIENGKRTCAITLSRGRIAVGDDVWRMSNKADMCEYSYRIYEQAEFYIFYRKEETEDAYPLPYEQDDVSEEAVV